MRSDATLGAHVQHNPLPTHRASVLSTLRIHVSPHSLQSLWRHGSSWCHVSPTASGRRGFQEDCTVGVRARSCLRHIEALQHEDQEVKQVQLKPKSPTALPMMLKVVGRCPDLDYMCQKPSGGEEGATGMRRAAMHIRLVATGLSRSDAGRMAASGELAQSWGRIGTIARHATHAIPAIFDRTQVAATPLDGACGRG